MPSRARSNARGRHIADGMAALRALSQARYIVELAVCVHSSGVVHCHLQRRRASPGELEVSEAGLLAGSAIVARTGRIEPWSVDMDRPVSLGVAMPQRLVGCKIVLWNDAQSQNMSEVERQTEDPHRFIYSWCGQGAGPRCSGKLDNREAKSSIVITILCSQATRQVVVSRLLRLGFLRPNGGGLALLSCPSQISRTPETYRRSHTSA